MNIWNKLKELIKRDQENAPINRKNYKKVWVNAGAFLVDYHFDLDYRGERKLTKKYAGHAYYTRQKGLTIRPRSKFDMREVVSKEGVKHLYTTNSMSSGIIWDDDGVVGYPHRNLVGVDMEEVDYFVPVMVPSDFADAACMSHADYLALEDHHKRYSDQRS